MSVTAPEDRRFRRGRAAPGQRRRRRFGRWTVAIQVAAGLGLAAVAGMLLWTSGAVAGRLRVARVTVQGNAQLSTGEVLSLLDGLVGQPVLAANLDAWRERVLRSPWVAEVSLRRALPDAIEVTVVERQPLAVGRLGDQLVLVDAEGTVIDEYGPRYEDFDLPIVDGLAQASERPGNTIQGPRARLAARFLADLAGDRALLAQVSQLDVRDPSNLVVWLDGDHARLMLGDRAFRRRLASYVELRPTLRTRVDEAEYVDLRSEGRVFVRPVAEPAASGTRPHDAATARAPS